MEPYLDNPEIDPEVLAESKASAEAWIEQNRAKREAEIPARLAILAIGPQLRDVQEALGCHCACHPRPADMDLHDGGSSCPCQQTEEQRAESREELHRVLASLRGRFEDETDTVEEDARQFAAQQLGVEVKQYGGMAPFVITGVVDGYSFYLRERHENYRIVIAGDDDPLADVYWGHPPSALVIAAGTEDDLGASYDDVETVLTFVVSTIRMFLLRKTCAHLLGSNFCSNCGVALTNLAIP